MKFPKPKRIEDRKLLDRKRLEPCSACGLEDEERVDPHHLNTVGASGDDLDENVIPLCSEHHTYLHARGLIDTVLKFKGVLEWLYKNKRLDLIERARSR